MRLQFPYPEFSSSNRCLLHCLNAELACNFLNRVEIGFSQSLNFEVSFCYRWQVLKLAVQVMDTELDPHVQVDNVP